MRKATATYKAPEGDAKSVNIGGVIFNDGESVDINSNDHPHLMEKLQGNPHFDFDGGEDDGEKSRGANQTRDLKAGIEQARDHDFEADQRRQQSQRDAQALAATPRRGRPPTPKPASDKTSAE